MAEEGSGEAKRSLGALHVASVVIGAIVGVGIFFTPTTLAAKLPSSAWILFVWGLGGVASVAGALVFAQLGARWPKPGGVYVFLREGFGPKGGPPLAFLYGWAQLLIVQPGSMAAIALVLADNVILLTGPLLPGVREAIAIATILAFTGANLLGLRSGARVQVGMAALKVGALAIVIALGVAFGSASNLGAARTSPTEGGPVEWLVGGLIPVLFSFGGAYHATYIAGSVRDPEKSVPRGIVGGIGVVLLGYMAINVAYIALLGHDGLIASKSPAADSASLAFGQIAGKGLAVVIVLSAAGVLNTACLGFPFVVYALARDGLFFRAAGRLHPKTERPVLAVAVQGVAACVAILVGSARVDVLLTGIAFADALFQGAVAIVALKEKPAAAASIGWRVRGVVSALTFLLLELGLAIGCLVDHPRESLYGVLLLLVGGGAYVAWSVAKRRGAPPDNAR